jgi:hypothetical protein
LYTESDVRIIAYELARTGGCGVTVAAKKLREEYESFRNIGESTIRRMLQKAKFTDLVAELAVQVREQQDQSIRDAERARMQKQLEGSLTGQLRAYDRLLGDCVKHFEQALEEARNNPQHDLNSAVRAFESVAKIVEKVRSQTIPAVADSRQASLLITIFVEETLALFGPEKAKVLRGRVRERYIRESEVLADQTETLVAAAS